MAPWLAVLAEPCDPPPDDALSDAVALVIDEDTGDYDRRTPPSYLERTLNEAPPYRDLAGGDRYLQTGSVHGDEYLPLSPRTLKPSLAARADWRQRQAFWDFEAEARIQPDGPTARARSGRARERLEAELVLAYVDRAGRDLEVLPLQVAGLFFGRRLFVAEIALRLRRSPAAIRQAVATLRRAAHAAAGGRPLRRPALTVPCPIVQGTPPLTPPTVVLKAA